MTFQWEIDGIKYNNFYTAVHKGAFGHIPVVAFRKAMLYDRMQASKPAMEKRVISAPKLVKPGQAVRATATNQRQQSQGEYSQSGGKMGMKNTCSPLEKSKQGATPWQTTSTFSTYDAVGNREDLSDNHR